MVSNMDATSETKKRKPKGEGSLFQRKDLYWVFQIRHAGETHTEFLGTTDANKAVKLANAARKKIKGDISHASPKAAGNGVLVSAIIEDYIEYANEHLKSGSIIEQVLRANFLDHSIAQRKASSITTADLKRYKEQREAVGAKPATIKNELSYLRAAFFRARDEHTPPKISAVPHFPIPAVDNTRTGFLEFEHYEALLSELPDSVKLAFVIAYHVGDRKGELLNIDLEQVQLEDGFIVLDPNDVKNATGRNLPIYGDMEKWLKWQLGIRAKLKPDHTKLFFWHPGDVVIGHGGNRKEPGSPIHDFRASWNSAVERMVTKTGQKQYAGLLFHDLRRSAVRNMVQKAGIPEVQAMKISGHKTASMLHRYNIVARQDVAEAGKKLNAWMAGRRNSA
jgi:integrase